MAKTKFNSSTELRGYTRRGLIPTLALKRLSRIKELGRGQRGDLYSLVPKLNPGLTEPRHLAPIVDVLEQSYKGVVKAVIAAPPQHGKSVLIKTALVQRLLEGRPTNSAYCTYNVDRAEEVSLEAQWMADEAGLVWEGTRRLWGVPAKGSVLWTGIGGGLTGHKVDGLLVIDDPIKDRAEARSKTFRDRAYSWLTSVAFTRMHPGASCVVIATRWHEDDISGRLVKLGWDYVNLPALDEYDNALWPEQRPVSFLQEQRANVGEDVFAALYQGSPRPPGGSVFQRPCFYRTLPESGYRVVHGTDLAYSVRTNSDYSVLVTLLRAGQVYYVVDVLRGQWAAPDFCSRAKAQISRHPPAKVYWHASGTEKGVSQFMRGLLPQLVTIPARAAKLDRALPLATAWNDGRILLPEKAPWLNAFVEEFTAFSGIQDKHDDQVDALSSAFAALQTNPNRASISRLPPL